MSADDAYVIRRAEPQDIPLLPSVERRAIRLFEGWLRETGLTPAVLDDVSSLVELEEARRQGHLWVATSSDTELVGFAQVVILDRVAHLDELDVVPEHGRKGVGSQLLATVCRWAGEAGYPRITLSTFQDVPWNRAFYEKRGFNVVDAQLLPPEHLEMVAAERVRGLNTDLRVIMEYRLTGCRIERLIEPVGESDLRALAELLVDVVNSGSAVSFLAPLTLERAEEWWRKTISTSHASAIFLVARDVEGIMGTVQLHPAWAPNQPHRAEIAKLLVHRRSRRTGLGTRLMQGIEDAARHAGFSLLTLDTKRGDAAEHLYRRLGWTLAGTIPRYALDPDGTPHDAVIFYKELNQADESRPD